MCFRELLDALNAEGLSISEPQIRWAITSGKIDRPALDGSLRFKFEAEDLEELKEYFRNRPARKTRACAA
jgi:hypothetical protein